MCSPLPSRICSLRDIHLIPSPLTSLVPYQLKTAPKFSIGEAVLVNGNYHVLLGYPQEIGQWIVWERPLEEILQRVVNFYDWNSCFHPLDILVWDKVCHFFDLDDFIDWKLFQINDQTLFELRRQVSQVSQDERELLLNARLDWKAFLLLKKRGLKLNPFTKWTLKNFQLSFQSQVQFIEAFHKFFKRKSFDAVEFLVMHQEYLETLNGSSKDLMDFMYKHASPLLSIARLEREKLIKGFSLPENIRADFDRSLETNTLNLQISIETEEDLNSLRGFLDDVKVVQYIKGLIETEANE